MKIILTLLFTLSDLTLLVIYNDSINLNLLNVVLVMIAANMIGFSSNRVKTYYQVKSFLVQKEKDELLIKTKEQLDELNKLRDLIPICASCKSVRDDSGYWNKVEEYLGDRINLTFTHSVCPDCKDKMLNEFREKD